MAFMLGAAAAACTKDTGGTSTSPTPVAYLRYFNAVADTGAVDFRVVDIVGYAPNQVQASFRSGGNPSGVTTTFYPPYQAVREGTRQIRVFLNGTTIATASTILLDTTYTFTAGTYYTFFAYGYANSPTNGAPKIRALITVDTMPTIPAASIAVRTLNLSNDTTGMGATVDAFVIAQAAAPAGAATIAGSTFLSRSAYVNVATGSLKTVVTRGGTLTAATTANLPTGVVGATTNCPTTERIAGSLVAGTSLTAVILPRSAPGTGAAAFAAPGVVYLVDLQPPNVCP